MGGRPIAGAFVDASCALAGDAAAAVGRGPPHGVQQGADLSGHGHRGALAASERQRVAGDVSWSWRRRRSAAVRSRVGVAVHDDHSRPAPRKAERQGTADTGGAARHGAPCPRNPCRLRPGAKPRSRGALRWRHPAPLRASLPGGTQRPAGAARRDRQSATEGPTAGRDAIHTGNPWSRSTVRCSPGPATRRRSTGAAVPAPRGETRAEAPLGAAARSAEPRPWSPRAKARLPRRRRAVPSPTFPAFPPAAGKGGKVGIAMAAAPSGAGRFARERRRLGPGGPAAAAAVPRPHPPPGCGWPRPMRPGRAPMELCLRRASRIRRRQKRISAATFDSAVEDHRAQLAPVAHGRD